jgi:hypothetical protein
MRRRLTALVLLVATVPATAAPFYEQHGEWSVMALGRSSCLAVNRPPQQFNASPYGTLALHKKRGGPANFQVFAWPNTFRPGDQVAITITTRVARIVLIGKTMDTYIAEAEELLPDHAIDVLRVASAARFEVTGMPKPLTFDLTQIEAVLKALAACTRQLPG